MNEEELRAGLAATAGYRYADRIGDELFVAGQVPLDADGTLVGRGEPASQATQCLDNLQTLVGVHGFGVEDIHRLVIYVVGDHDSLLATWRAVTGWFAGEVPPATLLGVADLGHTDQLVEIDARVLRG